MQSLAKEQTTQAHTPASSVAYELLKDLLNRQDNGDEPLNVRPSDLINSAYERARK